MKALLAKIKHNKETKQGKVHATTKKYENYGKIFHNGWEHLVSLRKVPGSDGGIHFDDMVRMEVNNYKGAVAVLGVLEVMKENEYNNVFGPHGAKSTKAASRGKGEITIVFSSLAV